MWRTGGTFRNSAVSNQKTVIPYVRQFNGLIKNISFRVVGSNCEIPARGEMNFHRVQTWSYRRMFLISFYPARFEFTPEMIICELVWYCRQRGENFVIVQMTIVRYPTQSNTIFGIRRHTKHKSSSKIQGGTKQTVLKGNQATYRNENYFILFDT